ncbi:MAG: exodeoxyribonuclease V subunit gamma, partial [Chlamydiales bacterium]|nr:exodeoxyribonuclease V subunit gamma [Chlamydiales bacterium]
MDTTFRPTVIVSNCVQTLLQSLKQRIQIALSDPFYSVEILVSDSSVKTVLQLELAKTNGILFGVEITTLQEYAKKVSGVGFVDLYVAASNTSLATDLAIEAWYGCSKKEQPVQVLPYKNHPNEVHVYAVSALCPHLIDTLSQYPFVTYHVLSPCMHFWGDVCSDREAKKLTRKATEKLSIALSGYLYDRSKLLANNGMLAREFIGYLQEKADDFQELYSVKKWLLQDESYAQYIRQEAIYKTEDSRPKLLDIIQADLLLMKEPTGLLIDFDEKDSSVEIHKAPTLYREVEILYQYIQKILPATPGAIVVFAPDIELYRPYIQSLFTHGYEVISTRKSEVQDAFFELLYIPYKRLTSKKIYELFSIGSIRNKCGIELEDLPIMAACLETFDTNKDDFDEQIVLTWISSLEKKLEFSTTDAEAIGKCLEVLKNLRADAFKFHEKKTRPLHEWMRLFLELLTKYFEPAYDEKDEYYVVKEALLLAYNSPKAASCDHASAVGVFSVALEEIEQRKEAQGLSKITFASIGELRTLTKDVVCFLGMNDAAFPRSNPTILRKFGFLHTGKPPYTVSAIDRHLFLEAILTTSCKLYISCQSFAFKERCSIDAAGIVLDILETLDKLCTINRELPSKMLIHEHPLESCVEGLFEPRTIPSNTQLVEVVCPVVHTLTITELMQVAKSPLKAYMQQGLGLYLREYKPTVRSSEFEVLNPRSVGGLKRQVFTLGNEKGRALIADFLHVLPKAIHEAAVDLIDDDVEELQQKAKTLGIVPDESYEIELSLTTRSVQKIDERRWKIPAIVLTINNEPVALTGTLSSLYSQGVVLQEKKSKPSLFKAWPEILLAQCLKEYLPIDSHVFFVKDAKSITVNLDEPKRRLTEYVAYALECRKSPSC